MELSRNWLEKLAAGNLLEMALLPGFPSSSFDCFIMQVMYKSKTEWQEDLGTRLS